MRDAMKYYAILSYENYEIVQIEKESASWKCVKITDKKSCIIIKQEQKREI